MGIKMVRFNITMSLEDFRITLDRVATVASQKKEWEDRGTTTCEGPSS
jgi:hypothetical protein